MYDANSVKFLWTSRCREDYNELHTLCIIAVDGIRSKLTSYLGNSHDRRAEQLTRLSMRREEGGRGYNTNSEIIQNRRAQHSHDVGDVRDLDRDDSRREGVRSVAAVDVLHPEGEVLLDDEFRRERIDERVKALRPYGVLKPVERLVAVLAGDETPSGARLRNSTIPQTAGYADAVTVVQGEPDINSKYHIPVSVHLLYVGRFKPTSVLR